MKNKTKQLAIALGESTHTHMLSMVSKKHSIEHDDVAADESIKFLLEGTGVITHEEHDTIVLPQGRYSKTNQVEFNPMDGTVNRVFD